MSIYPASVRARALDDFTPDPTSRSFYNPKHNPKPTMSEKGDKVEIVEADDEPDDWDKRIDDTGCAAENEKLRFCFVDRKDWRLCKSEMAAFRECWEKHGNTNRTSQTNL